MTSPYTSLDSKEWPKTTKRLVAEHPLDSREIVDVVLTSWNAIFASKMGTREFEIGKDISPKPQIMGFFLHEFIALELAARYPKKWRGEESKSDKDIVYIPDTNYSIFYRTQDIFKCQSYLWQSKLCSSKLKEPESQIWILSGCKF